MTVEQLLSGEAQGSRLHTYPMVKSESDTRGNIALSLAVAMTPIERRKRLGWLLNFYGSVSFLTLRVREEDPTSLGLSK